MFAHREDALTEYLHRRRATPRRERGRLFYVLQSGRLQCLNGAYLSQVDEELAAILLGPDYSARDSSESRPSTIHVSTGERIRELSSRVGQKAFSDAVRSNYDHHCCFPGCGVRHDCFLVGAHIARWADHEDLRGDPSNGLCLCLMHDRAFERGLFTISSDLRVAVNRHTTGAIESGWSARHVVPYDGQPMQSGATAPSRAALALHWERIGFNPEASTQPG